MLSLVSAGFLACESSNKTIDDVFAEVTRGAVFRSTTPSADVAAQSFNFDDPSSTYSVTFEVEDNKQGELLQDVQVYASFTNATDDSASLPEVLVTTLPASAFSPNADGLPSITVNLTLGELASALGLSESDYTGGDSFTIRYVLNLTDGRSFSSGNLNSTVSGGSYFRSPFRYNVPLVCPPIVPTSGTWTVVTTDSYGDGWNGGNLAISIDDNEPIVIANTDADGISDGSTPETITYTFEVPSGTSSIQIVYNGGSFDEEVSFEVISANGETVLDLGPEPSAGVSLFDFCLPLNL